MKLRNIMPKNKLLYLFFFTFCACKPIIIYRLPPEYVIIIDRRATGYDISVDHFVRDYYFNNNGKFLRVNDTIVPSDYHIYKWFYIDNKRIELECIKNHKWIFRRHIYNKSRYAFKRNLL